MNGEITLHINGKNVQNLIPLKIWCLEYFLSFKIKCLICVIFQVDITIQMKIPGTNMLWM